MQPARLSPPWWRTAVRWRKMPPTPSRWSMPRCRWWSMPKRLSSLARRSLADLMTDVDVILSPSAPGAAPKGLTSTGSSTFNRLWTLMGTPCVNVPGLADLAGLPLGMQVIGKFGSDRATLEAALFVESLLPRQS